MIGEITPLVQVAGRRTWLVAVLTHVGAAAVSGALLGLLLGAIGVTLRLGGPSLGGFVVVGAVLVLCAVRDAGLSRVALPSLQRQTPRWLRGQFAPMWYGMLWGGDLGQGWTTRILFTGYYGLVLWALIVGVPLTATLVFGAYGFGRGLPVLIAGINPRPSAERLQMVAFRQPLLQQANALALALVGAFLVAAFG